jgi:hypothetical protein
MVKVKSEADMKTNYTAAAGLVPARYTQGVKAATWQAEAIDGQALYTQRMQDPSVLARRSSGIAKVSDDTWRTNAVTKGAPIIGARMTAAVDKQVANYRPYRDALSALTLPDKVADPMTNLTNRAGAVVRVMVDTKRAQST